MRNRTPTFIAVLAVALLAAACATPTSPLVTAQKTMAASLDTVTAVLQADYDAAASCRALGTAVNGMCSPMEKVFPGAHKIANDLRELYPPALTEVNGFTVIYQTALATQVALQASKSATADQLAAANAAVTSSWEAVAASLAKLAVYTTQAETVWSAWKGGVK